MTEHHDPALHMAEKLGELSGVISTFQITVTSQLDDIKSNMREKIDKNTSRSIAREVVKEHEENLHKKTSIAPGVSLRVDKAVILKLLPYIVGASGAGLGIWAMIKNLFN